MASSQKKVLVPIAEGTEATEAVGFVHVLRCAGADATASSVEKVKQVGATKRVKLVADAFISDCVGCTFDLIAFRGLVGGAKLRDCAELESLIKKQATKVQMVASMAQFILWLCLRGACSMA